MKIIKLDSIKKNLIEKIKENKNKKTLLIISQSKIDSVLSYKKAIVKRCKEFNINTVDKTFDKDQNHIDIINYCKKLSFIDGFIILQPLSEKTNITYLRKNMLFNDLDGFTYNSLAEMMDGDFTHIPQTVRSIIKVIEKMDINLVGKDIVVANSTNLIGKPLFLYLNSKKATVTLLNSRSKNQKEKIKNSDIFISAIGDANFYDKKYFKDGQILIDIGVSYINGNLYGDIDYDSLSTLKVDVVSSRNGIGSINTLSLIESLVNSKI